MRSLPDWLIYLFVLILVVGAIYLFPAEWLPEPAEQPNSKAESDAKIAATVGKPLPPPSLFDDVIKIEAAQPQNGTGTAFAINQSGDWLTARHVVEGCDEIKLFAVAGIPSPVHSVVFDEDSDLAILKSEAIDTPLSLNLAEDLFVGSGGYHAGFPQGRPGEVQSRLHSQTLSFTFGQREGTEPVLIWIEQDRTNGLNGDLGGISGGPVFNSRGEVMSVSLAYSGRLGRLYSSAPKSIEAFLTKAGVAPDAVGHSEDISNATYTQAANRARASKQIAKLVCTVKEEAPE